MKKAVLVLSIALLSCFANAAPPSNSGIVTRGGYRAAWWSTDDVSGMGLIYGTDIVAFCSGTRERGFISYSDKNIRDGLRLSTLEKSDNLVASVWPFTEFNCERFLTELPLASGEVRRISHDNDLFSADFCEIKNNMNAFGFSVHGTLYSPLGEKKQLSFHVWGLFDCETGTFPVYKRRMLLTD